MPRGTVRTIMIAMRVEKIMAAAVVTVAPTASVKDVARVLLAHRISGVPVVNGDGRVLGVVSEGDFLVKASGDLGYREHPSNWLFGDDDRQALKRGAQTAADAMTRPAITIDPRATVAEAAPVMVKRSVDRPPRRRRRSPRRDRDAQGRRARLCEGPTGSSNSRSARRFCSTLWIDPATIDVDVEDGAVSVAGVVDTHAIAELIPIYVSLVPGVVSVDVSHVDWRDSLEELRPHPSRL